MQVYQKFDVDIAPAACNFIKNKAPAQLFYCEFLQPVMLFKM